MQKKGVSTSQEKPIDDKVMNAISSNLKAYGDIWQQLPYFNAEFMALLSKIISTTYLPQKLAHNAPPVTFGQKRHGSLTAAQWSTLCMYSLLIAVTKVWASQQPSSLQGQWLRNYWHLCCVVRLSHCRSVRSSEIAKLRYHCYAYVTSCARLFPDTLLRPSHHFLLHIADQTEWAGPIPERWAYPFERTNGWLQRVNTNHKPGKLLTDP